MEIEKAEFLRLIPELAAGGDCLYIGAKPARREMAATMKALGFAVDAIEAWPNHYFGLMDWNKTNQVFRDIFLGNVLYAERIIRRTYDVVMWWHGPEHVAKESLPEFMATIQRMCRGMIILAFPHGEFAQGPINGNPMDAHFWCPGIADFPGWAYVINEARTATEWPQIVAWKKAGE
jgi:hypothetical protein